MPRPWPSWDRFWKRFAGGSGSTSLGSNEFNDWNPIRIKQVQARTSRLPNH